MLTPRKPILALDCGTPSVRAIVFDDAMRASASAQREFAQHFPINQFHFLENRLAHAQDEYLWANLLILLR